MRMRNLVLVLALVLLPLAGAGSEEGMRVVPAQEILDKIEKGLPVEYDHVIIKGDLDLGKLDLPRRWVRGTSYGIEWQGLLENITIVSSAIKASDSIIEGNVSFSNAIFDNSVSFKNSAFNGTDAFYDGANFWNSIFYGDADFQGSVFNGDAYFWSSVFYGDADFQGSTFNGDAYFHISASFNGDAYFKDSAFNGDAYFGGSAFNGIANFWSSAFNGDAYFSPSTFNGIAYFGPCTFNRTTSFGGSEFNDTADFWRSSFNNSDFSEAQFSKAVTFDDARFNNSTSFNNTRFKDDALFEGAVFDDTLYLTRAKYDRLYIRWKNIKALGYDDAAYLALLENFKKLGYLEDYDGCYYEYRRAHRDQDWSGKYHALHPIEEWLRKNIFDFLLEKFYGYGKKPIWPLAWSALTIIFFGAFWRMAGMNGCQSENHRGILEKYGPQDGKRPLARRGEIRAIADALLFSATLFLSGTRLFVDPPKMPQMQRLSPSRARAAFIAERVLGAFFSILFFLAISGTVVR